ncbi:hypothetical protein E2C01_071210 [Portunus trituberculatus]|uniref:Uncharacterized protein n=1 Tax=Portunus trituberculatus TaxID=210409 RepID=A0A5B7I7D6_PORTR|nr:hypothetical protein [Portunus trituberculatus]
MSSISITSPNDKVCGGGFGNTVTSGVVLTSRFSFRRHHSASALRSGRSSLRSVAPSFRGASSGWATKLSSHSVFYLGPESEGN